MCPRPDESGTYVAGRIFGGQFCIRVPLEEVRKGDYIEFYRQGTRCRRVKAVHRGRKHNYVQFEPCKANPFKSQRINIRDISSVWRPQPTLEVWEKNDAEGGQMGTRARRPLPDVWRASVRRQSDS